MRRYCSGWVRIAAAEDDDANVNFSDVSGPGLVWLGLSISLGLCIVLQYGTSLSCEIRIKGFFWRSLVVGEVLE